MNPEIKAQWVAALRSGDYKQGESVLHNVDTDEYCCLGVLCDLAVKAGITDLTMVKRDNDQGIPAQGYDDEVTTLPMSVQEWAGLNDFNPDVINAEDGEGSLAGLNDEKNYTFTQLADLIEEQL